MWRVFGEAGRGGLREGLVEREREWIDRRREKRSEEVNWKTLVAMSGIIEWGKWGQ